jgi:hypothetical protein
MLFILAMDPLQKILDMATQQGLLSPIGDDAIKMRTSLYTDDAMLFLRPIAEDVSNLQHLLQHFGMATDLCTNIQKSHIFPIRCDAIDIPTIVGQFQVQLGVDGHKMHIFIVNIPIFHSRYKRYVLIINEFSKFFLIYHYRNIR